MTIHAVQLGGAGGELPDYATDGVLTWDDVTKTLAVGAAGIVSIGTGFEEFTERADPAAGAVNTARLYAKDNGAGKTQLVVRFNTGAVQVIATEP